MSHFGLMPHRKQCSVIPKTGKSYSIFNEQIPSTFLWIELLTHRKGNDLKYWQNCELEKKQFINLLFIGHLTFFFFTFPAPILSSLLVFILFLLLLPLGSSFSISARRQLQSSKQETEKQYSDLESAGWPHAE